MATTVPPDTLQAPTSIVIRAPNWLGDLLISTAFLQAVLQRFPGVTVDVIAPRPWQCLKKISLATRWHHLDFSVASPRPEPVQFKGGGLNWQRPSRQTPCKRPHRSSSARNEHGAPADQGRVATVSLARIDFIDFYHARRARFWRMIRRKPAWRPIAKL